MENLKNWFTTLVNYSPYFFVGSTVATAMFLKKQENVHMQMKAACKVRIYEARNRSSSENMDVN